ncbi:MAG: YibE/F family protein [Acidimicrobiales bacterium]|nr:YibE/F family protein [Acidimicrobiales bacterium]
MTPDHHDHQHLGELDLGTDRATRVRRLLALAMAPCLVATAVALVVMWPAHAKHRLPAGQDTPVDLVHASVTKVVSTTCQGGARRCDTVTVQITSGPDAGDTRDLPPQSPGAGVPDLRAGDKIVVGRSVDATGRVDYYFSDYQRSRPLLILALIFAVFVVAIARWKGLAAVLGVGATYLVLVRFVLPSLLDGHSPIGVALAGSAVIVLVVVYAAHGVNTRTTTAVLGTLASLALTGLLASAFVHATRLTGLSSDEATSLQTAAGNVPLQGLVLAGIIIGSLGVLNDVTVTQASAVWEVYLANPSRSLAELYRSGMRIGRDHIASTVYTLVLAYAGAALPLLLLFTLTNRPFGDVITGDVVAEEIVRALVGSIGLVASVPITTGLAALVSHHGGGTEVGT